MLISNYLLMRKGTELSQRTLNYFLDRLTLFLQISIPRKDYPKIKRFKYIDSKTNACFDHDKMEVQFAMDNYRISSDKFIYNKNKLDIDLTGYNFCISLNDIYHELIHFIQYKYIDYTYTPYLEATNELFIYILTGSFNIEYKKEAVAFWYVLRHVLGYKSVGLYKVLRNSIVKKNFVTQYLLTDKYFRKLLSKTFDNDIKKFMFQFTKLDVNKYSDECWKELDNLHNLIFYKW